MWLIPRKFIYEIYKDQININVTKPELKYFTIEVNWKYKIKSNGIISDLDSAPSAIKHHNKDLISMTNQVRLNPDLRSMNDSLGCHLKTEDGIAGRIWDFILNQATLNILYVVVNIRGLLPGKKVLLPTSWIKGIDLTGGKFQTNLHRATIHNAPAYNPNEPLCDKYSDDLIAYYSYHNRK
jgi:hypothetical protein